MQIPSSNHPLIMGIVNLTPDSFYSNCRNDSDEIIKEINNHYSDIIDIGCESSRPGARPVCEKEELSRLTKFLNNKDHLTKVLSIDTYKPSVARFALENGFNMINDIKSGDSNNLMLNLAAEYDCPIVLMHMQGNPETMQINPYYDDIMGDIISFFDKKLSIAQSLGIKEDKLILDPGIGFGKCVADNDTILQNLHKLKQFNHPILIGLSRKSFLSVHGDGAESRLSATIGATVLAMQNGADILRVHDIEETYKVKTIIKRISKQPQEDTKIVYN